MSVFYFYFRSACYQQNRIILKNHLIFAILDTGDFTSLYSDSIIGGVKRMSIKDEIGRTEYHYGFYGAIHTVYEPTCVKMEYLQEFELGDEPVRMDMLILKHDATLLTDPIGSFFKTYNILEYKSPEDHLSINDFYKAQGYALIYKGLSKTADTVPLDELTVSIFRHAYPREMFRRLKIAGFEMSGRLKNNRRILVTSVVS